MKNAREQIKNKLLVMMKNNNIYNIKVTALTDALGIGRSTFYLYFDSVFDVLQEIEDSFFEMLKSATDSFWNYPLDDRYLSTPHPIMLKVMHLLNNSRDISKTLWGPYGDPVFQNRCKQMILNGFFPDQIASRFFPIDTELHITFLVGGHLECLNSWLNSSAPISEEDFTLLTYKMMFADILNRL